jgi:putative oxidoreductase
MRGVTGGTAGHAIFHGIPFIYKESNMRYLSFDNQRDGILLVARILLMVLFILFGWQKLTGFAGTVNYMISDGLPLPTLAAIIAVVVELGFGLLIAVGFFTRPIAVIFAVYTVATAFIGHRYWALTGMEQYMGMINFYKNISIAGGLLLLAVTGPGRYAIDRK